MLTNCFRMDVCNYGECVINVLIVAINLRLSGGARLVNVVWSRQ